MLERPWVLPSGAGNYGHAGVLPGVCVGACRIRACSCAAVCVRAYYVLGDVVFFFFSVEYCTWLLLNYG